MVNFLYENTPQLTLVTFLIITVPPAALYAGIILQFSKSRKKDYYDQYHYREDEEDDNKNTKALLRILYVVWIALSITLASITIMMLNAHLVNFMLNQ